VLFEVRMTAYDQPAMLRRALESVQAQSYPHWKVIVYDDSSSPGSGDVVGMLADGRIVYHRNPKRLGAVKNIDQCFSPERLFGGHYGCLLEDDNYWFPDYLSSLAEQLHKKPWSIVQVNQRLSEEGAGLRPASETTRGGWFSPGHVDPLDLRATLLLMEGVSNSGLVWKLGDAVDLRIGDMVREAGLNEFCRSLLIGSAFLFIEEPRAAYTLRPKQQSARAADKNRAISRGMQSIRDFVLNLHGVSVIRAAKRIASKLDLVDRFVESVAYSGHPSAAGEWRRGRHTVLGRAFVKGLVIRLLEKDPCGTFLDSGRPAKIPVLQ
jgi:glycosyltransferase involved in cell wall biosynthesis